WKNETSWPAKSMTRWPSFSRGSPCSSARLRRSSKKGGDNSLAYVERAIELAQFGLAEARRTAFSLQPTIIEELGLVQALQKLVERSNIPGRLRCNFHSTGVPEESLPPSAQEDLLRIAQEAMSNAVRHAKPTVINVSLRCDPPNLVLEITDNGSGITDPQTACIEGFGLSNMQARAEKLGRNLTFELPLAVAPGSSSACPHKRFECCVLSFEAGVVFRKERRGGPFADC